MPGKPASLKKIKEIIKHEKSPKVKKVPVNFIELTEKINLHKIPGF